VRKKSELETASGPPAARAQSEELQGVFIVNNGRAEFRKVETGITGPSDIEVTSGLQPGEEIITGSYKVIRTLRNQARVVVDNKPAGAPGS